jgi:hypothetical protein
MDKHNKIHKITGSQLLRQIRLAVSAIGKDILGFSPNNLGLHSARSGAAMAMYLAGVPIYTIMLLGRWSSDAFLCYICKQVKEFSNGISKKMLTHDKFFLIPNTNADKPRTNNKSSNHSTSNLHGLCFNNVVNPLLTVFN